MKNLGCLFSGRCSAQGPMVYPLSTCPSINLSVYQSVSLGFPACLHAVGGHSGVKVTASFLEKMFPLNFVVKGSNRPQNEAFRVFLCLILSLLFAWNESSYDI